MSIIVDEFLLLALVGLVLTVAAAIVGYRIHIEHRLTKLETKVTLIEKTIRGSPRRARSVG